MGSRNLKYWLNRRKGITIHRNIRKETLQCPLELRQVDSHERNILWKESNGDGDVSLVRLGARACVCVCAGVWACGQGRGEKQRSHYPPLSHSHFQGWHWRRSGTPHRIQPELPLFTIPTTGTFRTEDFEASSEMLKWVWNKVKNKQ